jgi:cob(I)alamin adenosyltransferase
MAKLDKGYIQIYTGNGKGKTTAALGLAIRAVGAGLKVYIAQFVKGQIYSELKSLKKFKDQLIIERFGRQCFIYKNPTREDIDLAQKGFDKVQKIIKSKKYDVIILDEINIALYYKLISLEKMRELLVNKPNGIEIIITGRYAPKELIDLADLVTEMKEIKHYYTKNVSARCGIEK